METFLQQTAKSIIEKLNWQQLSHTTLVLPSHRAGLVLKNELLRLQREQNQKAVWAPTVRTLQQLQDALSPLYAEDELFTVTRLYRHYRALVKEQPMPLDIFYGWGRQMIADFTNIDASMHAHDVDNFFDNTIAAHELSEWELDAEVEERLRALLKGDNAGEDMNPSFVKKQYRQLWQHLHTLYDALRAEMFAEQKGYPGMRQRAVIEQWEEPSVQEQIAGRTFVFVGFNYLLPVERELMQLLKQNGQALFYWDFVPDFATNDKAFSFARINSGILGSALPPRAPLTQNPLPVTLMACTSREAQAQYVHRWLQTNYTEKGQRVGVVICDETMLESVIYTLPAITLPGEKEPEPINITKGFPLRNTDVYARVTEWLYDRKRGDAEQLVSPDFIDDLLADVFPVNADANADADDNAAALSWQELLILESEYQVRKVFNQMRQLLTVGLGDVPFTLKLFRLLVRRVMENVTMPFHGEPVTDMQIMGVLETRLLDFDKLLILNAEEGIIPQTQAENSFIPYYLRKVYSMQTSDERATVYAYNFFRLLSRAGHSTLLFATADSAENSKGMSRFIMQMLVSPEFIVEKAQLREQSVLMPFDEARLGTSGTAMMDLLRKDSNNQLLWQDGKVYSLSPSAINTYVSCPRLFCFQYIQGLHEPEEEEAVFSSATLGTFVHSAVQHIYMTHLHYKEGVFTMVSPDEIEYVLTNETCLADALKAAYVSVNEEWAKRNHSEEKEHYKQAEHRHEEATILAYVRHVLERDARDAKTGLKYLPASSK